MKRRTAINRLRALESEIRAYGAKSLYLFGSVSRDAAHSRSDIDIFIDYDKRRFGLFELAGLKAFLEDRFDRKVHLMTRDGIHRLIRDRVTGDALRVF
jgi:predicted nucleotidyltransferase